MKNKFVLLIFILFVLNGVYANLVYDNGNVGIGTTNPGAKLSFGGNAAINQIYLYEGTGVTKFGMGAYADQTNIFTGAYGSASIGFGTFDGSTFTEKMRVQSDGKVGIGTTNPGYKLQVNGTTQFGDGTEEGVRVIPGTIATYAEIIGINAVQTSFNDLNIRVGSDISKGIYLQADTGNVGIGTTDTGEYKLAVNGNMKTEKIYVYGTTACASTEEGGNWGVCDVRADYAELMYFSEKVNNGDVVVIDIHNQGAFRKSTKAYDKLVAGVVSQEPAMVIGTEGTTIGGWESNSTNVYPLAVAGKKRIKVTEENGKISPGDLLVTSSESGKAMRCDDYEKCQGAILGKAMTSVGEDGKVLALITLQ